MKVNLFYKESKSEKKKKKLCCFFFGGGGGLSVFFLAHLSLLRVSFWDTMMSVVRRTCGRP